MGLSGEVSLIASGGIRGGADVAKALALGADAVAIGIAALVALNCNRDIPEADYENEVGVKAGFCHHCQTGKCPVGITTQDPELEKRLDSDEGANRVANFINSMTMELALITRSLGKSDVKSLEPEDMAALTLEASAMARVPLVGTERVFGWD
jgi:glutamate synthase domain-containing protein 2